MAQGNTLNPSFWQREWSCLLETDYSVVGIIIYPLEFNMKGYLSHWQPIWALEILAQPTPR